MYDTISEAIDDIQVLDDQSTSESCFLHLEFAFCISDTYFQHCIKINFAAQSNVSFEKLACKLLIAFLLSQMQIFSSE